MKVKKCFLCESTENLMDDEVRLMAGGNQKYFWLCNRCKEALEKERGIEVCFMDLAFSGVPGIQKDEICVMKNGTCDC